MIERIGKTFLATIFIWIYSFGGFFGIMEYIPTFIDNKYLQSAIQSGILSILIFIITLFTYDEVTHHYGKYSKIISICIVIASTISMGFYIYKLTIKTEEIIPEEETTPEEITEPIVYQGIKVDDLPL